MPHRWWNVQGSISYCVGLSRCCATHVCWEIIICNCVCWLHRCFGRKRVDFHFFRYFSCDLFSFMTIPRRHRCISLQEIVETDSTLILSTCNSFSFEKNHWYCVFTLPKTISDTYCRTEKAVRKPTKNAGGSNLAHKFWANFWRSGRLGHVA